MLIPNSRIKKLYILKENYKNVRHFFGHDGFCAHLLVPYTVRPGSGSPLFVCLHTNPDPTFIKRIRVHGSGSASLIKNIYS